jgi:hypothetical protein
MLPLAGKNNEARTKDDAVQDSWDGVMIEMPEQAGLSNEDYELDLVTSTTLTWIGDRAQS